MQDIHTHLYWESFDEDRTEVLKRAEEAGVTTMLVVGTDIEENEKALQLANEHDNIFASLGVHPNNFREPIQNDWSERLSAQLENEKVVAVGECGLDYSESHGVITEEQKEAQKQGFITQLHIAEQKGLPVIVHCRAANAVSDDAYWDLLAILKTWSPKIPHVVLHCYMGGVKVTEEFLQIPNIYFSFTGNITYPVKKELEGGNFDLTKVVKQVPLERIFTETDCPFLAPQAQRGKRNEPAFVVAVAERIAELHGVSVVEISQITQKSFHKVFGG